MAIILSGITLRLLERTYPDLGRGLAYRGVRRPRSGSLTRGGRRQTCRRTPRLQVQERTSESGLERLHRGLWTGPDLRSGEGLW